MQSSHKNSIAQNIARNVPGCRIPALLLAHYRKDFSNEIV
jgi:hypothetical protein